MRAAILLSLSLLCLSALLAASCSRANGARDPRVQRERDAQGARPRGAVTINELYPGHHADSWIEIKNRSPRDVDISGWFVTDKTDRLDHYYQFPPGTVMEPGRRLLIWTCVRCGRSRQAPFTLARTDSVYLLNARGLVEDAVSFHVEDKQLSLARVPDGEGLFLGCPPTPGALNLGGSR
jgi:hypothetical protein